MNDYVNCRECGAAIDSDFSVVKVDENGFNIFFCNERHKKSYMNRAESF
jgi:hypothetical protein